MTASKTETKTALELFTAAYVSAAIWSSTDEDGEPLDGLYTADDVHADALATMTADCSDFLESLGHLVASDPAQAGHDFWLSRNGHGAGFFDSIWGGQNGYLQSMARPYGGCDLYVGDDGYIHCS